MCPLGPVLDNKSFWIQRAEPKIKAFAISLGENNSKGRAETYSTKHYDETLLYRRGQFPPILAGNPV